MQGLRAGRNVPQPFGVRGVRGLRVLGGRAPSGNRQLHFFGRVVAKGFRVCGIDMGRPSGRLISGRRQENAKTASKHLAPFPFEISNLQRSCRRLFRILKWKRGLAILGSPGPAVIDAVRVRAPVRVRCQSYPQKSTLFRGRRWKNRNNLRSDTKYKQILNSRTTCARSAAGARDDSSRSLRCCAGRSVFWGSDQIPIT